MPKLKEEVLNAAILGFEEQKRKIDAQIAELRAMITGKDDFTEAPEAGSRRRRKMSAAGRKAIAEAQRKRWAAAKGETETPAPKAKRKLSAAGKANIIAALKKRWAAKKAATKAAVKGKRAA